MTRRLRALRWLLGGTLIAAGASKLVGTGGPRLAPILFAGAPPGVGRALIAAEAALPAVEILTGIATACAAGRLVRHVAAVALAAAFGAAGVLLPPGVRCDCLGVLGGFESRGVHVTVAGVLLVAAAALWIADHRAARNAANP